MKKLLSLFGSLSLVATSSVTVLACGTKDKVVTNDNSAEISKLIDDFKLDLQILTEQFWREKTDFFFDTVENTTTTYNFLEKKAIKEYVDYQHEETWQTGAIKGDYLSDEQKRLLVEDIDKILSKYEITRYFEDNIDQEKYAILIEDINFYQGFTPEWISLEINYTESSSFSNNIKASDFTSYVSLNLNLNFNYLDYNGEIAEWSLSQKFIFNLSADGALLEAIKLIEKNITYDYYLSGGKYSWFDSTDFGLIDAKDKGNIFNPKESYFTDIYKRNSDFETEMLSFIKANYLQGVGTVPLEFTVDNIFDSYKTNDYTKAERTIEYEWTVDNGSKLYDAIFSDLIENDRGAIIANTESVNPGIYEYITKEFMYNYQAYNSRYQTKLAQIETQTNKKLEDEASLLAFDNSISNGFIKIKGLAFVVNETYSHPINDFSFFISLAVNNIETKFQREYAISSSLKAAMYYNITMGVQAFQDVFDIQTRENYHGKLPIARFSGAGLGWSGALDNIWFGITTDWTRVSPLSQSLSLGNEDQFKARDTLLEAGRQRQFLWGFNPTIENSYTSTSFIKTEKGVTIDTINNGGDKSLTWYFKQDLIDVSFKITGIWSVYKKVAIEKTTKR